MPESITLDTKDLCKKMTLVVRFHRAKQWEFRLVIARWLIALAAWVAWMNVEFEDPCYCEGSCGKE